MVKPGLELKENSVKKSLLILFILTISLSLSAEEKIKLGLSLSIGDQFKYEYFMKQEIEQNLKGKIIKTSQSNGTTYDFVVDKISSAPSKKN